MNWFFKSIIYIKVICIAGIFIGFVYLMPEIVSLLEGALARIDHVIGYQP